MARNLADLETGFIIEQKVKNEPFAALAQGLPFPGDKESRDELLQGRERIIAQEEKIRMLLAQVQVQAYQEDRTRLDAQADKILALESQVRTHQADKAQLIRQEGRINELDTQVLELQGDKGRLTEINTSFVWVDNVAHPKLLEDHKQVTAEKSSIQTQLDATKHLIGESDDTIKDLKKQKSGLEQQKSDLEHQKRDFRQQKGGLEQQKRELEQQKGELELRNGELEQQKRDLEQSEQNAANTNRRLQEQLDTTRASLDRVEDDLMWQRDIAELVLRWTTTAYEELIDI